MRRGKEEGVTDESYQVNTKDGLGEGRKKV
jgi:hypothetical protein